MMHKRLGCGRWLDTTACTGVETVENWLIFVKVSSGYGIWLAYAKSRDFIIEPGLSLQFLW